MSSARSVTAQKRKGCVCPAARLAHWERQHLQPCLLGERGQSLDCAVPLVSSLLWGKGSECLALPWPAPFCLNSSELWAAFCEGIFI